MLLTGDACTIAESIQVIDQQQVANLLADAVKTALVGCKVMSVLGFVLWNDAIQGFYFRPLSGPTIDERGLAVQKRW